MRREALSLPIQDPPPDPSENRERQGVAYVLASHLRRARSDKKAATIFSHAFSIDNQSRRKTRKMALQYLVEKRRSDESEVVSNLPEDHKQKIDTIREALTVVDQKYLEEKKDNFRTRDRAILLFKAKISKLSGLNKEEKINMYKEAGYTDDEILRITGKKLMVSAGLSTTLAMASNFALAGATTNEKLIPFIDKIPENYAGLAMGASLLTYTASYAYLTEKNLRLTKKFGGSTNSTATAVYLLGNRLVPEKTRDWLTRGIPVTWNAVTHSGIYPLITAGVTESPTKIIAGSLVTAGLNVAYAAGCEVFLRKKKRKDVL